MSKTTLNKLDKSIRAAVSEMKKLRRENERLREKAAKLEQRLEKSSQTAEASSDWVKERQVIRDRVEQLTEQLEGVLAE